MATIDYTRREKKLQNADYIRGSMAPIVPDKMAGVDRTHAWERAYARKGRGWDMATEGVAKLGKALIDMGALLQEREDERKIDKAAGMVMGIHDRNLTNTDRDDNGIAVGLLNRTGESCLNLPQEGHESLTRTLQAVSEELELSDKQVEMLKGRLSPYARSCMGRLRARQMSEMNRVQLADAEALWQRDVATIADGNDSDEMYETALKDYGHYLDLIGSSGEARKMQQQTFVRTLFAADVKRTVAQLGSAEDFDAAIDRAEKDPSSLFMGNEVLKREMGGKVGDELHRTLLKEMREERDRFIGREKHEKMVATEQLKGEFVKQELDLMGKDIPQTEWVQFYRDCGNDERLRKVSPETALKYLETAERLDKAIKKGVSDQTEDSLSLRMTNLMMMEVNGDAELNGGKIAAEQAAIWRDYQTALHAGVLSEGFANSYLNRIKNRLTDEERNAMREFYSSFGWHGDLNGEGEPSAKDRKDWAKEKVLAPVDETQPLTGDVAKGRKLTGAQMFELGDMFLRQLRTMGPEAYRPEAMRTMIGEIKARRMADDFNRNRDLLAQKLYNIQRNLNAGVQNDEGTGAGSDAGNDGSSQDGGEGD